MRLQIIITSLIIYFSSITKAQNLVPNPSFEELNENKKPLLWIETAWSPDPFFCDENSIRVREGGDGNGEQCIALEGNVFYGSMKFEVLSVKLKSTLIKDKKYYVSIYASKPPGWCQSGVKKVSVAFTKGLLPKMDGPDNKFYTVKYLNLYPRNYHGSFKNFDWKEYTGIYIAKGDELYLNIGLFGTNLTPEEKKKLNGPDFFEIDSLNDGRCTYFIYDLVTIEPILEKGKTTVLENVYFETDKSNLLPSSNLSLDKLYNQLQLINFKKIKINGHTDSSGNETNNKKLSEERAKEVMKYLVKKGIPANKITFAGYGGSKPISDNTTPEGKAKNRRVDVELMN